MRRRVALLVLALAGGCTPLPAAPRLVSDASRADITLDVTPADVTPADVTPDAPTDASVDAPLDTSSDVPRDVVPDVARDAGSDAPRFTGAFVSSAVTAAGSRLSGGFTWQGAGASTRVEGWVR